MIGTPRLSFSRILVTAAVLCCLSSANSWGGIAFLPGDYNGDGWVDAQDAAVWAANYGGVAALVAPGGSIAPAISLAGDGDFDGDVDQDDYVLMFNDLGLGLIPPSSIARLVATGETALIYNATTGELSIDDTHTDDAITSFFLTGLSSSDVPGMNFPYQRFVPGSPPGDTVGLAVDFIPGVGQTDINGMGLPTTPFSFGDVLPTGLSESDFANQFGGSFYLTQSFGGRQSFTLFVTQVPEPASVLLLAIGLGGGLAIRRRVAL